MSNTKPKILILFYSMYGHVYELAKAVAAGVEEGGGEPVLKQAAELIPEEKWSDEIKAGKELMKDIPAADPKTDLKDIDGLFVGTPTRFGNMTAQMRNFWDQTTADWFAGTLVGKPAGVFTSSATQHGGQETTIITTMVTLLHQGCVLVGLPYSFQEQMTIAEITGGSPYGASTIAGGRGERWPSANELALARHHGRHLAEIAMKLKLS